MQAAQVRYRTYRPISRVVALATRALDLNGLGLFEDLARDTYAEPENFYSYRRCVHRNEQDYGRQIAAITLL